MKIEPQIFQRVAIPEKTYITLLVILQTFLPLVDIFTFDISVLQ